MTIIETAFDSAASALGIKLTYPKPVADTIKRRDAAAGLASMKPRDAATEIAAADNPRTWPSILDSIAEHNARYDQAQTAIRGGLVSKANVQIDRELTAWVPHYCEAARQTVTGVLDTLADGAVACTTLSAEHAIANGYGAELTALYGAMTALRAHTAVGIETTGTDRSTQAARALAMIVAPPSIEPIRRREVNRINAGGEIVSSPDEVARRDTARRLMSGWIKDKNATIHALSRGAYPGFELGAATADNYDERVTQFVNAERTIRVAD